MKHPDMRAAARLMRLALFCFGCALTGCTSLQVVERPSADAVARDYGPRDRVVVVMRNGQQADILVMKATPAGLLGTDASGRLHEIAVEDIEQIQVRRFSAWKTVSLALLVAAAGVAADIKRNGVINGSED